MSPAETEQNGRTVIIACRVMEPEIAYLLSGKSGEDDRTDVLYLEQALHRTPAILIDQLQRKIGEARMSASRIVLGYGLCAKGIVGGSEEGPELIIPRCHDCIALFLGSPSRYLELFREKPGTYYLTPGWVAEKKDPLGIIEEQAAKYGRETAQWVIEEELKHYTHIALIDTGVEEMAPLRARAIENAVVLRKEYEEITGSLAYFREILHGPYGEKNFLSLRPGEKFVQEMVL